MMTEPFVQLVGVPSDSLTRGEVLAVNSDGSVQVATADLDDFVCDRLHTGAAPVLLAPNDVVLCLPPGSSTDRGVVLGRIGPSHAEHQPAPPSSDVESADDSDDAPLPDSLLLEAKRELTLRVGEGSITIRADGKILIKGTDLVSHAKRMNRIKGGAVSIN